MAGAIMICGKICCGKTTYARQLRQERSAVLLSADDIMLSIFGQHAGEKHDEYCERLQKYLFDKSLELIDTGVEVILDWGFWSESSRRHAKAFYLSHNVKSEFHYLNITDEIWRQRLEKRNREVIEGKAKAYFIDENLAKKFDHIFEIPFENEIDVWINC